MSHDLRRTYPAPASDPSMATGSGTASRAHLRVGAGAAVIGSLCAGVGNLLHPATPRDDAEGVAHVVAHSEFWTPIHLLIAAGVLLMVAGLFAIRLVVADRAAADRLTRLGMHTATIGATVGMVTVILDGVAAKQLADAWAAAPRADRPVALTVFTANETVNFALAGLFNLSFAGIPFVLFGLAVAGSGHFPPWLGWVAVAAGTGSVAAGTFQALTGRPTMTSLILTLIGPTVISLWLLVMGALLWRQSPVTSPVRSPVTLTR